jgi:hypothetical protein
MHDYRPPFSQKPVIEQRQNDDRASADGRHRTTPELRWFRSPSQHQEYTTPANRADTRESEAGKARDLNQVHDSQAGQNNQKPNIWLCQARVVKHALQELSLSDSFDRVFRALSCDGSSRQIIWQHSSTLTTVTGPVCPSTSNERVHRLGGNKAKESCR